MKKCDKAPKTQSISRPEKWASMLCRECDEDKEVWTESKLFILADQAS